MRNLLCLLVLVALVGCSPKAFLVPDFEASAKANHRLIAILPFEVSVLFVNKYHEPVQVSLDEERRTVLGMGATLQQDIVHRLQRYPKHYTVQVQDTAQTNKQVRAAHLSADSIRRMPGQRLARLLGVDAVVRGQFQLTAPKDDPGGWASIGPGMPMMRVNPTKKGQSQVTLHDGRDGRLLWEKNIRRGEGGAEWIMEVQSSALAEQLPYRK